MLTIRSYPILSVTLSEHASICRETPSGGIDVRYNGLTFVISETYCYAGFLSEACTSVLSPACKVSFHPAPSVTFLVDYLDKGQTRRENKHTKLDPNFLSENLRVPTQQPIKMSAFTEANRKAFE